MTDIDTTAIRARLDEGTHGGAWPVHVIRYLCDALDAARARVEELAAGCLRYHDNEIDLVLRAETAEAQAAALREELAAALDRASELQQAGLRQTNRGLKLVTEMNKLREELAVLPAWTCPSCGAETRARMADREADARATQAEAAIDAVRALPVFKLSGATRYVMDADKVLAALDVVQPHAYVMHEDGWDGCDMRFVGAAHQDERCGQPRDAAVHAAASPAGDDRAAAACTVDPRGVVRIEITAGAGADAETIAQRVRERLTAAGFTVDGGAG